MMQQMVEQDHSCLAWKRIPGSFFCGRFPKHIGILHALVIFYPIDPTSTPKPRCHMLIMLTATHCFCQDISLVHDMVVLGTSAVIGALLCSILSLPSFYGYILAGTGALGRHGGINAFRQYSGSGRCRSRTKHQGVGLVIVSQPHNTGLSGRGCMNYHSTGTQEKLTFWNTIQSMFPILCLPPEFIPSQCASPEL